MLIQPCLSHRHICTHTRLYTYTHYVHTYIHTHVDNLPRSLRDNTILNGVYAFLSPGITRYVFGFLSFFRTFLPGSSPALPLLTPAYSTSHSLPPYFQASTPTSWLRCQCFHQEATGSLFAPALVGDWLFFFVYS